MTYTSVILIFVFALGASFIQRVTGFGFGIFIMTILPYLMPSYGEATALSGILATIGIAITLVKNRQYIEWKKLLPILLTFLAVSFFAVLLVSRINDRLMKHILGGILIAVSIYFFRLSDRIKMKPTLGLQIGMGTLSGLMGGLFAMQGPPAVIYFLGCTDRKENYIALTAAYFVIGNIMMTLYRAGNGFFTKEVGIASVVGIPAVLLGLFFGNLVFSKIPVNALRKIIYAFMGVAGIIALVL